MTDIFETIFIESPIVSCIVNGEGKVERINRMALQFVEKNEPDCVNQLGGVVFNCVNSYKTGGCGRNEDCRHCPIRSRVERTLTTGESFSDEEGAMTFMFQKRKVNYDFLISTKLIDEKNRKVLLSLKDITELKNIEKKIVEERNEAEKINTQFKEFLQIIDEGYVITDKKGFITRANIPMARMLGYEKPDELIGINIIDFYCDPDDRRNMISEINTNNVLINHELKLIKRDQNTFWCLSNIRMLFNDRKEYIGTESLVRDITAIKRVEEQLKVEKERLDIKTQQFELIFNSTGTSNSIFDTNCRLQMQNNESIKALGKDGTGLSVTELFGEEEGRRIESRMKNVIKTREFVTFETEFNIEAGKRWFRSTYQPVINENDDVVAVQVISQDITERKEIECQLKASKELAEINELKYKTIFEGAPIGIFRSTKDGRFIELNRALAKMIGYESPEEVLEHVQDIGKQIYVSSEKRVQIMQDAEKSRIQYYENIYKRKNGERFYANLFLREIKDEFGNDILEGIVEETTERKNYEMELIKAKEKAEESSRLKTAFLNNLSHEIRTPMNGIMGFAKLLTGYSDLPQSKIGFYSKVIWENSNRLLNIIDNILKISKLDAEIMEIKNDSIDIREFIQSVSLAFRSELEMKRLNFVYDNNLSLMVITDEQKLFQIVTNLVQNAIKFTDQGEVRVNCQYSGGKLKLSVKDTGIGIRKENLLEIFERFVKVETSAIRAYEGTGLGLSIAKGFTEFLGGKIWCESTFGEGSEFFVEIPAHEVSHERNDLDRTPSSINNQVPSGLHILIAEDEQSNVVFLSELLDCFGNKIVHVTDGLQAVEAVKAGNNFDFILMDIKMPVMDGLQAAREILKMNPEIIIIAQTAYATKSDEEEATRAGCRGYITKPIIRETLFALLSNLRKID